MCLAGLTDLKAVGLHFSALLGKKLMLMCSESDLLAGRLSEAAFQVLSGVGL